MIRSVEKCKDGWKQEQSGNVHVPSDFSTRQGYDVYWWNQMYNSRTEDEIRREQDDWLMFIAGMGS